MLKIFSMAKWDWAACGYFLSEAINATTDNECRAYRMHESTLAFPYDLLDIPEKRVRELWDWADVVHVHDASGIEVKDWTPKPAVITFHGTRYRNAAGSYHKMLSRRGWLGTVATPDLTQFGLAYLPDCRPDLSAYYDPPDRFTVAHAPTKREVKGTERVIAACKRLGIDLVLVENKPWQECLRLKGRAHVLVDQFGLGYGCNAIEAWSMGMPVIADAGPDEEAGVTKQFGYLPYARAGDDLEAALDRMKNDDYWRTGCRNTGYAHYKNWHSYEATARIALDFYRKAMTKAPPLPVAKPSVPRGRVKGKTVLVRYLGGSMGVQSWFGSVTDTRYLFSTVRAEGYVYAADVEGLLGETDKRNRPLFEVVG